MIHIENLSLTEQIYSHKDKTGKEYTIAIQRLRQKLQKRDPQKIAVNTELATEFAKFAGLEQHRLRALVELTDAEFDSLLPAVVLWFKDNTWVMADGNHQYVVAFMRGRTEIPALIAQRQDWTPFIVKGARPKYESFSGIVKSPAERKSHDRVPETFAKT